MDDSENLFWSEDLHPGCSAEPLFSSAEPFSYDEELLFSSAEPFSYDEELLFSSAEPFPYDEELLFNSAEPFSSYAGTSDYLDMFSVDESTLANDGTTKRHMTHESTTDSAYVSAKTPKSLYGFPSPTVESAFDQHLLDSLSTPSLADSSTLYSINPIDPSLTPSGAPYLPIRGRKSAGKSHTTNSPAFECKCGFSTWTERLFYRHTRICKKFLDGHHKTYANKDARARGPRNHRNTQGNSAQAESSLTSLSQPQNKALHGEVNNPHQYQTGTSSENKEFIRADPEVVSVQSGEIIKEETGVRQQVGEGYAGEIQPPPPTEGAQPSSPTSVESQSASVRVPRCDPTTTPSSKEANKITESWISNIPSDLRSPLHKIPDESESPSYLPLGVSAEQASSITDSDLLSIPESSETPGPCNLEESLSPLQSSLLAKLMLYYDLTRQTESSHQTDGSVNASQDVTSSSADISCTPSQGAKREFTDSVEGSGKNAAGETESKKLKLSDRGQNALACPYWKRDSERYRACCKLAHRRIRDVKQHLHRRHTPEFYCQRCFRIFEDAQRLDSHLASDTPCIRPPQGQLDGITVSQSRALSKKSDRKLSEEEQWFAVWRLLFPSEKEPCSAYVDVELSEEMSSFHEYWENRGHDILMEQLDDNGMWALSAEDRAVQGRQFLARALGVIYNRWVARRRITQPPTETPRLSSSPHAIQAGRSNTSLSTVDPSSIATPVEAITQQQDTKTAEGRHNGGSLNPNSSGTVNRIPSAVQPQIAPLEEEQDHGVMENWPPMDLGYPEFAVDPTYFSPGELDFDFRS